MYSWTTKRFPALFTAIVVGSLVQGLTAGSANAAPTVTEPVLVKVAAPAAQPKAVKPSVIIKLAPAMVEEYDARTGEIRTQIKGEDTLTVSEAANASAKSAEHGKQTPVTQVAAK